MRSTYRWMWLCLSGVLALPVHAAGWNPEGQSQQLEAAQEAIAKFRSAVIARDGAAAQTSYDNAGVALFIHVKGGGMLEAAVGGQQFDYQAGLGD